MQAPLLQPWPGPHSVLVLDNCRIHKSPELRALVEARGAVLLFLPTYSPEFNPVSSWASLCLHWRCVRLACPALLAIRPLPLSHVLPELAAALQIEHVWGCAKAYLRRRRNWARTVTLQEGMHWALQSVSPAKCRGFVKHCRVYNVP